MYPVDEKGKRKWNKRIPRPPEVEPYIWWGMKVAEQEAYIKDVKPAAAAKIDSQKDSQPTATTPVVCAPLGWSSVLLESASGPDPAPIKHAPIVASAHEVDHFVAEEHAMVDVPPWEQFDRGANDYLVSSASPYWNGVDGSDYTSYPTAGAVPTDRRSQQLISHVARGRETAATPEDSRGRRAASGDRGTSSRLCHSSLTKSGLRCFRRAGGTNLLRIPSGLAYSTGTPSLGLWKSIARRFNVGDVVARSIP